MEISKYLSKFLFYMALLFIIPIGVALVICQKIHKYFKNEEKNRKNIRGEVAVITGAARGFGRDIAIELAKRGCHIAVADIRDTLAEETADYLRKTYNIEAKAYKVDVSDYQQLVGLQHNVTHDLGHATILVNNAAILLIPLEPKPEEIQKMIDVNFTAVCFINQIFLPKMKELNRGYILTISSLSALFTLPEYHVYAACKSSVRSLLTAMRIGLMSENKNIISTTIMPWLLNSNKQVEENFSYVPIAKFLPLIESQVAAQIAVEAMLNGEEELTVPRISFFISKIRELLPTAVTDITSCLLYKWFIRLEYGPQNYEKITENSDTLPLLQLK